LKVDPLLTVAICTYRRFDELEACLKSFEKQTLSREKFKVLVIDNSLQKKKSERFKRKIKTNYELEYVITPKNGIAYARNVAIQKCNTRYLGYIDDDVSVPPNWGEVLLDTFKRHGDGIGCVSGLIVPKWTCEKPDWIVGDLLYPLACTDWGTNEKLLSENEWVVTASIGFDMRALSRTKGFMENLGRKGDILLAHEDLQISLALRDLGYGIIYNPALFAEHQIGVNKTKKEWFYKDFFWQAVSFAIFTSGISTNGLDGDLGKELNGSLDKKLAEVKNSKREIRKIREEFRILALKILKKYNIEQNRSRPTPPYPCIYMITPSFNSAETIQETLMSVCNQKGDFYIRYHVQDGGSSDETLKILSEWKRLVDEEQIFKGINKGVLFTYSSESDKGMYDAIVVGFSKLPIPQTAAMGWINSDDIIMPNTFAMVSSSFENEHVNWVTGRINVRNENGVMIWTCDSTYPSELIKNGLCDGYNYPYIQQEGIMWKKWLWDRVGGLDINLKYAGDWNLWRKFAEVTDLFSFKAPTGCFTIREGQLSQVDGGETYTKEINNLVSPTQRKKVMNRIIDNKEPLRVCGVDFRSADENYIPYTFSRNISQQDMHVMPLSTQNIFYSYFEDQTKSSNIDESNVVQRESVVIMNAKTQSNIWRYLTESKLAYVIYHRLPDSTKQKCKRIKSEGFVEVKNKLKRIIREKREYRTIIKSGLFMQAYYLSNNPDVHESGINPLLHYLRFGSNEGRKANPYFDDAWYYSEYPDVLQDKSNAFAHYLNHGWKEGRDPSSLFSTNGYLSKNNDIKEAKLCPLRHLLFHGLLEGRSWEYESGEKNENTSDHAGTNWFDEFVYSKSSHWELFKGLDYELYNESVDPKNCDLKRYQDLFILWYIKKFVPKGSRLLEVGGGQSRILTHLSDSYECWNVDKLEGLGNGPEENGIAPYKLVRDYMGTFNTELPDDYFDMVFSISALEHTPQDGKELYSNIYNDINRVLKPGGESVHLLDIVDKKDVVWHNAFLIYVLNMLDKRPWKEWESIIRNDENLFVMNETLFNQTWAVTTGKSYSEFGRPASFNLFWKK